MKEAPVVVVGVRGAVEGGVAAPVTHESVLARQPVSLLLIGGLLGGGGVYRDRNSLANLLLAYERLRDACDVIIVLKHRVETLKDCEWCI